MLTSCRHRARESEMKAVVYAIVLLGGMAMVMMSTTAMLAVEKTKLHRFARRTRRDRVPTVRGRFLLTSVPTR